MSKPAILAILFLCMAVNCNEQTSDIRLDLPDYMQLFYKFPDKNGKMLIYYHSGECSICYGILCELSKEFPELPVISISSSIDTIIVEYYHENIKFRGISLHDKDSLFQKANNAILSKNRIFLINSDYKVLAAENELDEKIIKSIKEKIY